ncbi:MAG: cell division protein FtsZ [candidate division WOR-3 bacterium]|nr:cell division protein FtsZ [candidate division WOR-3 bacterium]
MFKTREKNSSPAKIRVVGVGGCGGNAITTMISSGMEGVQFWAVNADVQDISQVPTSDTVQIGRELTHGRGTGGDPELGRKAAEEDLDKLQVLVQDIDMLFITAGMGGGTGTGASPVIASLAKERGVLTVGVVTTPFSYEASRIKKAEGGIKALSPVVDTLLVVPNDRLLSMGNVSLSQALSQESMDVLMKAVRGISNLILKSGYINMDFADVKAVMSKRGKALMGIGVGEGENMALEAAQGAINSPLLNDTDISQSKAALVNLTVDKKNFTIKDMKEAMETVKGAMGNNNEIFLGVVFEENWNKAEITLIATGIGTTEKDEVEKIEFRGFRQAPPLRQDLKEIKELNDIKKQIEDLDVPTFLRKQMD